MKRHDIPWCGQVSCRACVIICCVVIVVDRITFGCLAGIAAALILYFTGLTSLLFLTLIKKCVVIGIFLGAGCALYVIVRRFKTFKDVYQKQECSERKG